MTIVQFGSWTPDLPSVSSETLLLAQNIVPGVADYKPFPSLISSGTEALPSRCHGAISVKGSDTISRIFLGTSSKLYEVTGTSLSDSTRLVGGDYSLVDDEKWFFVTYKNRLIASCWTNEVQVITLGDTHFSDLFTSTRKPKGRCLALSNLDWLTLGNVTDSVDGDSPTRIWWCERANPANADPNVNDRSGFRDLSHDYGEIVSLHAREFTAIFQERAAHRMTFVGGAETFRFDLIEVNVGPIGRRAIAHFGAWSWYLSEAGFFEFNGTRSAPIGEGTIDRYVLDRLSYEHRQWISTAINPKLNLVLWAIPLSGSNLLTSVIAYNWISKKFTIINVTVEIIFPSYSLSAGLDDADYFNLNLDDDPQAQWTLDSPQFLGGISVLSGVDANHKYVFSGGTSMPATFATNYQTLGNNWITDSVIPLIDGMVNGRLQVQTTDRIGADGRVREFGPYGLNAFGEFRPSIQARYIRYTITMDDFTKATGLEINAIGWGMR